MRAAPPARSRRRAAPDRVLTTIMNEALTRQTISSTNWGVDLIGRRHLGREASCLDVPPLQIPGAP